jgi:hypothetical protein
MVSSTGPPLLIETLLDLWIATEAGEKIAPPHGQQGSAPAGGNCAVLGRRFDVCKEPRALQAEGA